MPRKLERQQAAQCLQLERGGAAANDEARVVPGNDIDQFAPADGAAEVANLLDRPALFGPVR
jgi:hypothetical protein